MLEFEIISAFYGEKMAQRSQAPLINHIKEGLLIMQHEQFSELAQRAYCLHPIFQADDALKTHFSTFDFGQVSPQVIVLTLEYRNIANQYLSYKSITEAGEIALSPLPEVNQMLFADKIQNCKDFERYHQQTHPRSAQLTQYFANWFKRLGITQEKYAYYCELLA
jgi:hypothetical protein